MYLRMPEPTLLDRAWSPVEEALLVDGGFTFDDQTGILHPPEGGCGLVRECDRTGAVTWRFVLPDGRRRGRLDENEVLGVVEAFRCLGLPADSWPDLVRA